MVGWMLCVEKLEMRGLAACKTLGIPSINPGLVLDIANTVGFNTEATGLDEDQRDANATNPIARPRIKACLERAYHSKG